MKRRRIIAMILALALAFALAGCNSGSGDAPETTLTAVKEADKGRDTQNLMSGISKSDHTAKQTDSRFEKSAASFALELFKTEYKSGKNTLVSPLSVLTALAMTQNGAEGKTLSELEAALGGLERDTLNAYMAAYLSMLTADDTLKCANSLWVSDKLAVESAFLQKNADFYSAQMYKADFSGTKSLDDINRWVREQTDGKIEKIVDFVDHSTVMILLNALSLDAKWKEPYTENCVRDGYFTNFKGGSEKVEYMYSSESEYIETDNAKGFVKRYAGDNFAFVALLPNEGVNFDSYVSSLGGTEFLKAMESRRQTKVNTQMPKFKCEYNATLVDTLQSMGIKTAFNSQKADFSSLGQSQSGNIYISNVVHKTFIEVGEEGTKAAAITAVMMDATASAMPTEEPKEVRLTRPFVYAIIDTQTNLPIFIGAQTDF